ncbi:transglutaminase-like domain-containing protein [Pyrococcus kukulkanii]|uniref:transglutaminase-like domain-containing protein n=1 Tax=Pyrococcus kukulkanii TaxID=1609559 RepID=UPI003567B350
MRKLAVVGLLILLVSAGCLQRKVEVTETTNEPQECLTSNLTLALTCYIPQDWDLLANLSAKFKNESLEWTIWNILKWEEENLRYDDFKNSSIILRPSEFLKIRKGVCTDYTVLTAGILLALNVTPIYVLIIHFSEMPTLHSAVAVEIGNYTFILDQKLPPHDLGSYWESFAYNGKVITFAEVYMLNIPGNVSYVGIWGVDRFRENDYTPTYYDAFKLSKETAKIFRRKTGLFPREELRVTIPPGFSEKKVWVFRFKMLRISYNPIFLQQYATMLAETIIGDSEVSKDLQTYKAFWTYAYWEGDDLVVKLFLAK